MDVTFTAKNTAGFLDLALPEESRGMVGDQAFIGITQYNMIFKYNLEGYSDQPALPDEQHTLMDDSVEAVYGEILIKFKKLLVEEGENDIIVDGTHNFIYELTDTVIEGNISNRFKAVINIRSVGSSKFSDTNKGKWLFHGILSGPAWVF